MTFNQMCGLPDMTLEEELSLPENMMETKKSKIIIMGCCGSINRALETIELRTRNAPLKDDPNHAELMREFTKLVKEAEKIMWRAAEFGRS